MTLRELRTSKGLCTSYVARQLGLSARHFTRIENGDYLTEDRIKKLAKLYGVRKSDIKKIGGKASE